MFGSVRLGRASDAQSVLPEALAALCGDLDRHFPQTEAAIFGCGVGPCGRMTRRASASRMSTGCQLEHFASHDQRLFALPAKEIFHQPLLADRVDLVFNEQFSERRAQFFRQLAVRDDGRLQALGLDLRREFRAAETAAACFQEANANRLQAVLLIVRKARSLAGRWRFAARVGLLSQQRLGQVDDAERRDDGPDVLVLLRAGHELFDRHSIRRAQIAQRGQGSLAAHVFVDCVQLFFKQVVQIRGCSSRWARLRGCHGSTPDLARL